MQNSRRTAGLALLIFTLGTLAAFTMTKAPAGSYDPAAIHSYLAANSRVSIIAGGFVGLIAALALLVYLGTLRAELPPGRARDLVWGAGVAAAATAGVGWATATALPVAVAQGGSSVNLPPSIVYMMSIVAVLMVYGPAMFFTGVALVVSARQLPVAPGWWRGLTYAGGACAILSAAFFPFYLFVVWGVIIGVWSLATGGRSVTPTQERIGVSMS
jgi:hypothetical protein